MIRYVAFITASAMLSSGADHVSNVAHSDRLHIDSIGKAIREGRSEQSMKQVAEFATRHEIDEVMHLYTTLNVRKRLPNGGVAIETILRIIASGRMKPTELLAQSDELETMAWRISALAEITATYAPSKDNGEKTRKTWLDSTDTVRSGAIDFRRAFKAKRAEEIVEAATRIVQGCDRCHGIFR